MIDPAVAGSGFDHGKLPAHLVGCDRHVEAAAGFVDQVEVGHGRLDHDHVGALFQVQFDFPHGLAPVGRVHLVTAPVAELRSGFGRLTKRPVEHRGEFSGVRKDRNVGEAIGVQLAADGRHASVHHVRGGHDIGAGAGVRNRRRGQPFERLVVIHVAVDDLAAMPVAGVFTIANVGDYRQAGNLAADGADGALHDAIVGIGARRGFVLAFRQAEQDHAADAERPHLGAFTYDFVHGQLEIAGHGPDFAADTLTGAGKQGQNELGRIKAGLPHEAADRLARAQPAHAVDGERHP